MRIAQWGNSLAVRLPAVVVEAPELKEGDDLAIHVVGSRAFDVEREPSRAELIAWLRRYRGLVGGGTISTLQAAATGLNPP